MKIQLKFAALLMLATALTFTACGGGDSGDNPGTTGNLVIGDAYGGGIVAYILVSGDPGFDPSVQHGLIVATVDQSTSINWAISANLSTLVSGTLHELGSGSANTDKIIAQNGTGTTYAAGLARAYNGGGFDDWYLPSINELNKLYLNKLQVGGFASNVYWSSTETSADSAYYLNFSSGYWEFGLGKRTPHNVRAVRSF
jgi:hypothetical protein